MTKLQHGLNAYAQPNDRGCGVTAAYSPFKRRGKGSTPFGPTDEFSCNLSARSSVVRAGLL